MSHSHTLTPDSEFRYIVSWFREFSEYEKADFMAILIQWLLKPNEIYVNGMTDSMASKPMSLFSCRIKLFKDWTPKWPSELRSKLIDKINEIDSDFGLKLNQELEDALKVDDEQAVVNGFDAAHTGMALLTVSEE